MYHFGLKIGTTDDELREALAVLQANDVEDRGGHRPRRHPQPVHLDPDGNEIELYIDVQPEAGATTPPPSPPMKPLRL